MAAYGIPIYIYAHTYNLPIYPHTYTYPYYIPAYNMPDIFIPTYILVQ